MKKQYSDILSIREFSVTSMTEDACKAAGFPDRMDNMFLLLQKGSSNSAEWKLRKLRGDGKSKLQYLSAYASAIR